MEHVVLLDQDYNACGTLPKELVHHENTPLHLAFSCYVVNSNGQLLLTRRALEKKAWPGVWSNSFCGHPQPEENIYSAVGRRGEFELGLPVSDAVMIDKCFSYMAKDSNNIVENEFCPVFLFINDQQPVPNPQEVMDYSWSDLNVVFAAVDAMPQIFSPWMIKQLRSDKIRKSLFSHAR